MYNNHLENYLFDVIRFPEIQKLSFWLRKVSQASIWKQQLPRVTNQQMKNISNFPFIFFMCEFIFYLFENGNFLVFQNLQKKINKNTFHLIYFLFCDMQKNLRKFCDLREIWWNTKKNIRNFPATPTWFLQVSRVFKDLHQPWATQIGSKAKFLLNSHIEGQSTGFFYRFSRFSYEILIFQSL